MGYSAFRIAGVAQLVEHLIRNEGVVGSSPITGTIYLNPIDWDFFYISCLQFV